MKTRLLHWFSWAPLLAAVLLLAVALASGAAIEGYSHAHHPLAMLGARGMATADAFNLLGWGVPGLLLAVQSIVLRECLPGSVAMTARLGGWLLMLSALAFAAQGLWPLDPGDLEGEAGRRHAIVWMLWWIANVAGAGMSALGLWRQAGSRRAVVGLLLAAAGVLVSVLAAYAGLSAALAGRLAVAAWLAGYFACGALMRRQG